jgi:hypothetical protein
MEHAKTCQRPISLERRLAATYLVAGLVTAGLAGCAAGLIFSVPPHPMWLATLQHRWLIEPRPLPRSSAKHNV